MFTLPAKKASRRPIEIELKDFRGGSNLLVEEARLQPNESLSAKNLIQVQDGVWKTRWGRAYYGEDVGDTIDGADEYLKSDGTTETIVIAGGEAKKSTDGGSWTTISGASFTAGTQCYFLQIGGYLYIINGIDPLTRYDGSVLTRYTELSAPTGLSACIVSGLASGIYPLYGVATALNDVGETIGSSSFLISLSKKREDWNPDSDLVSWQWNSVSGARRYQLYIGEEEGFEGLLSSTVTTKYEDSGTVAINTFVSVPDDNTTTAPLFKSMALSGNRQWATNDPENEYRVYFSGSGQYMGYYSPYYGGGWINLERGGREKPTKVIHYQSGQGEGRATVLCRTPEGKGAVWQIDITSITVGDTTITTPSAVKVVGSSGTDAMLGVVATNTDIMFPNKKGWYALGPQRQYFGILRTSEISSKIRPYWRSLIGSKISNICAFFYDAKILISVPTSSAGNDRTIIYDTERNNWTVDWTFGAKQFFEYTDSDGRSHLLMVPVSGTRLIEISENIQGDLGLPIETDYTSGRLAIDKLFKEFARIRRVYVKLGSPRGTINFEVSGTQRNKPFSAVATKSITPQFSLSGHGYDLMGSMLHGDSEATPNLFSDKSDIRYVDVRKKIRDIQLRVTSTTFDTDYTLLGFIIEGVRTRTRPPRLWKI